MNWPLETWVWSAIFIGCIVDLIIACYPSTDDADFFDDDDITPA